MDIELCKLCKGKYFIKRYNACCNCNHIEHNICEYCNKTAFINPKEIRRFVVVPKVENANKTISIYCTNCNDRGYIYGGFPNELIKKDYKESIVRREENNTTRCLLDKAHYQKELQKQIPTMCQNLHTLIDEYLNKEKIIKYLRQEYNDCNYFTQICNYYFCSIFKYEKKYVFAYDEIVNGQYNRVERLRGLEITYMYNKIDYTDTITALYNYMKIIEFDFITRYFKVNIKEYKPCADYVEASAMYNMMLNYNENGVIILDNTQIKLTTFEELWDIRNNVWNSSCINRYFHKPTTPAWVRTIANKDMQLKKKWCADMKYLTTYWNLINSQPSVPDYYKRFHPEVQRLQILCELFENIEKYDSPMINGINYKYLPIELIEQIFKYDIFYF